VETHQAVLVVDDNEDNRELVAVMLRALGYETLHAVNGAHALEILESNNRPCLIVLDLAMPVMDGWTFRSEQLARADLRSIPVVLYSAHPDLEQHARGLGAAGYVKKPVNSDRLLAAVKAACA
jgi:CheY-like chemotaxis protein